MGKEEKKGKKIFEEYTLRKVDTTPVGKKDVKIFGNESRRRSEDLIDLKRDNISKEEKKGNKKIIEEYTLPKVHTTVGKKDIKIFGNESRRGEDLIELKKDNILIEEKRANKKISSENNIPKVDTTVG